MQPSPIPCSRPANRCPTLPALRKRRRGGAPARARRSARRMAARIESQEYNLLVFASTMAAVMIAARLFHALFVLLPTAPLVRVATLAVSASYNGSSLLLASLFRVACISISSLHDMTTLATLWVGAGPHFQWLPIPIKRFASSLPSFASKAYAPLLTLHFLACLLFWVGAKLFLQWLFVPLKRLGLSITPLAPCVSPPVNPQGRPPSAPSSRATSAVALPSWYELLTSCSRIWSSYAYVILLVCVQHVAIRTPQYLSYFDVVPYAPLSSPPLIAYLPAPLALSYLGLLGLLPRHNSISPTTRVSLSAPPSTCFVTSCLLSLTHSLVILISSLSPALSDLYTPQVFRLYPQ